MRYTPYNVLTDDELLKKVDEARTASPLIEALAARLEIHMTRQGMDEMLSELPCPVCEAPLLISYDEDTSEFTIKKES